MVWSVRVPTGAVAAAMTVTIATAATAAISLQTAGAAADAPSTHAGVYRVDASRALRAVSDFRIGWEAYAAVRDEYADTGWYRAIIEIFPFFTYREYGEALVGWSAERSPGEFFRRLGGTPALGIYFEFDQSNPPDSPRRFRRALEDAGNARVVVKTFRGTNHGAWVVDGYGFDPDAIERRNPEVFDFLSTWVAQF